MTNEQTNSIYSLAVRYWYGDHDPGSSETTTSGELEQYDSYENLNTGKTWTLTDATPDALVWMPMGNYSPPAWTLQFPSLAFNTARTPSTTNNVTIIASFAQSSTVLTAAIVNVQLYLNNSWTTVGTASLSGLLTSQTNSVTFDVPMNIQYRFISSSGSNTVSLIVETLK